MESFNLYQQIYCLSSAANAIGSMANTEAVLQKAEEVALGQEIPTIGDKNWSVVWGPRVYKQQPNKVDTGPENVWYCAVNNVSKVCVMAMAGTAYKSYTDWLKNGDVIYIADLDGWTKTWTAQSVTLPPTATATQNDTRALISYGTAEFVTNILNNNAPQTGKQPGTKVTQFLRTFQARNPDYTIVFTGHSMGGAVVPAIALGLVQSGILVNKNIWVMPSAGPTPGNSNFNTEFAARFPASKGSGYKRHNVDYYNTNDIVPQAWSVNQQDDRNLGNIISKIYNVLDQGTANDAVTLSAFAAAYALSTDNANMSYRPLQGQSFTGSPIPEYVPDLEGQIIQQHTTEYWKSIGILSWVNRFKKTLLAQPGVIPIKPKDADMHSPDGTKSSEVKPDAEGGVKNPAQVDVQALPAIN